MNVRSPFRATGLFAVLPAALALCSCGETAPPDAELQVAAATDQCGLTIPVAPMPVNLHLTTIKMNGHSVNSAREVTVSVTLPGMQTTSRFIGYYTGTGLSNPLTQFNCSSVGALPGSDGYCTTSLPLPSTVGSTAFTGSFPVGVTSGNASVKVNGVQVNFTIDNHGHTSQTCATTWLYTNGTIIDGDKITVCWAGGVADPITAPPALQTIFYSAPGEGSSVSLKQSNTISTKTTWSGTTGGSVNVKFTGELLGSSMTLSASTSYSHGETHTSGSATGFTLKSKAMFPDPNDDTFAITYGIPAAYVDFRDGTTPTVIEYLSSGGYLQTLTMRELKGLAQTPQDFTDILPGNQCVIKKYITPQVAQGFLDEDPFYASSVEQALANNPDRFQPATHTPLALWHGDRPTSDDQVTGSGTDTTVGLTIGGSYMTTLYGVGLTGTDSVTYSVTHSDMNQSTGSITLDTKSPCVEGYVDLYMDKKYGTIVSLPHLMDACNAPVDSCLCDPNSPDPCYASSNHVLLPDESLAPGQSLQSCNHKWTLTLQPNGMLVENYQDGSIATSFYTPGANIAIMQGDGNFVVYDPAWNALANTGTYGNDGRGLYFILQNDGSLNIYQPTINVITGGSGAALPRGAFWTMLPGG
jgi:hypothetical protein